MKKSLLIGTIVVLVLAIAGGAIAFAVWDQTKSNIELTTTNVASNVKVEAKAIGSTSDNKNLIPSIAEIRGANDAETVKVGEFTVTLSSDNKSATAAELAGKVKATYSVTGVTDGTGNVITFTDTNNAGAVHKWDRYLEIIVSTGEMTNGVIAGAITDSVLTLKTDNATTTFYTFVKFKDFSAGKGYTDAEMEYIRSLSGKQFKIAMLIKIESKATVAA